MWVCNYTLCVVGVVVVGELWYCSSSLRSSLMHFISYEAGIASKLSVYTISVYKFSESFAVGCGEQIGRTKRAMCSLSKL